jgi:CHAD domain-containing protein
MPSRAYRLRAKEDAGGGVRRIAAGRAEKALERLGGGEEDLAVAIHGARKELKKLRALLRLVRDELGKKAFRAEDRRYRDAGRLLSGSRDAEVKLATLLELRQSFEELPPGLAGRWESMLETGREEMAAAMREETGGKIAEATATIEAGLEAIRQWSPRTDSWTLVGPGLSKTYRDGRQAMKRALAEPSAENVHEWRKRAKNLWYQLRVVEEAWPELLGATVGRAHELTDLLGDHHDLAVLAADLRSRIDLGDRGPFEAAIAERQEELLDAAFGIGRRLYAEKPKAFRKRLRHYWLIWREA